MVDGPPPIRMSSPPAALRAWSRASAGLASMKWNVVPPGMMGEHEDRRVEGRIVPPPAFPLLVRPRAALRAELVPPHDLRTDARSPVAGKGIVDARFPARHAVHVAEGPGGEEPLHQPVLRVPEGSVEALSLACAEPVQRDGEVVHAHLGHDDLLTHYEPCRRGMRRLSPMRTLRRLRSHRRMLVISALDGRLQPPTGVRLA